MIIESQSGKKYELVIGLEIHAQINSNSKIFSTSENNWNSGANQNISPMDIALPGALPVINIDAVQQVIRAGIAINATINTTSYFDRKNYFYPDLPSGYQITQFYKPIVENGYVEISTESGEKKRINIQRIHIEQDAGKSIHDRVENATMLDFNRAGIGLMEIVSYPEMKTPHEATEYTKKIRSILKAVKSSDADMEKGSMRVDVNVSVMPLGTTEFGTRCEIKNLNSIRSMHTAIEYEAKRQVDIIESGGKVTQETRLFDSETLKTRTMREKVDAVDYKYFPDPDLPPLKISQELISKLQETLPELPEAKFQRYQALGLSEKDSKLLAEDSDYSDYFDKVIEKHDAKNAYTWIMVEMLGRANKANILFNNLPISPENIIELLGLIAGGIINGKIAKNVMDEMFENIAMGDTKSPKEIVQNKGLQQIDNTQEIKKMVQEVVANYPAQAEAYKAGNAKLLGFFVGEVMKIAAGKANPASVNKILLEILNG